MVAFAIPAKMNAVLAIARPDELPELLAALPMFERCGMPEAVADEWRRRILALIAYDEADDSAGVA